MPVRVLLLGIDRACCKLRVVCIDHFLHLVWLLWQRHAEPRRCSLPRLAPLATEMGTLLRLSLLVLLVLVVQGGVVVARQHLLLLLVLLLRHHLLGHLMLCHFLLFLIALAVCLNNERAVGGLRPMLRRVFVEALLA